MAETFAHPLEVLRDRLNGLRNVDSSYGAEIVERERAQSEAIAARIANSRRIEETEKAIALLEGACRSGCGA